MYPLIPLQLFNLRKKLHSAKKKNDINTIKELSIVARNLAEKLANESKELFDQDEILGEVLNMLGEGLDEATISKFTKIDIQKVKEIIKKHLN